MSQRETQSRQTQSPSTSRSAGVRLITWERLARIAPRDSTGQWPALTWESAFRASATDAQTDATPSQEIALTAAATLPAITASAVRPVTMATRWPESLAEFALVPKQGRDSMGRCFASRNHVNNQTGTALRALSVPACRDLMDRLVTDVSLVSSVTQ